MLHIPSFIEIGPPVPEKNIQKGFYYTFVYKHGGHLGHVTWTIYTLYKLWFPLPMDAPHEVWLWSSCFRGEDV